MNAGRRLARVADAEVDHLDPAAPRLGPPVVEPRERILRELGEQRRELHAQRSRAGTRWSASYVRPSSAISTRSSAVCA